MDKNIELKDLQITDTEVVYQPPVPQPVVTNLREYYEHTLEALNNAKTAISEAQPVVDRLQPIIDQLKPKYDALVALSEVKPVVEILPEEPIIQS